MDTRTNTNSNINALNEIHQAIIQLHVKISNLIKGNANIDHAKKLMMLLDAYIGETSIANLKNIRDHLNALLLDTQNKTSYDHNLKMQFRSLVNDINDICSPDEKNKRWYVSNVNPMLFTHSDLPSELSYQNSASHLNQIYCNGNDTNDSEDSDNNNSTQRKGLGR